MPAAAASRRSLMVAGALMAPLLLAAAGCTRGSAPDPEPVAIPQGPPLRLGVSGLEVQDQVQGLPLNFIDRRRTDEMVTAVRRYLASRVQATGGSDFGRAVIEEASVVERPIPRGGIAGAVAGPAKELVGTLAVRLAVTDGLGVEKSYARAKVELRRGVAASSSVFERDLAARGMMADLLAQLDRSLEAAARENLGSYLAGS
jgi:hypothetical protein